MPQPKRARRLPICLLPVPVRAWALCLWLIGLSLLPGCAIYDYFYGPSPQREAQRTDQQLLRSAEAAMQRRRFEDARGDFQRLLNQYPDSDLVTAARLGAARTLYMQRKYDEARAEYQRFLELHPQHERSDEAHYYLAMAYFRHADTPDRDQTFTQSALEHFELILSQMPASQYAPDAQERRALCRRKLAEKELYVGRFYHFRGHYAAAVARLTTMLTQYPGAGFDDEALYFLGDSLWELERKGEAYTAFQRVVREHSQSEWAAPAAARLGITLVRVGPPKPKGPGALERMWQGLGETWEELRDTIKDYRLFQ